jgi:hypothetical protein
MLINPFNAMVALTGWLWQKSCVVYFPSAKTSLFLIVKAILRIIYDKADP